MKKLLFLMLMALFATVPGIADSIKIPITREGLSDSYTGTGYNTTEWTFISGGKEFAVNNCNSKEGQIRVNQAAASNFYIFNKSAINKISKVVIEFSSGTPTSANAQNYSIYTSDNEISNTTSLTAIKGELSGSQLVFTISEPKDYFRIAIAKHSGNTVKASKITIEYSDGSDTPDPDLEDAGYKFSSDNCTADMNSSNNEYPTLSHAEDLQNTPPSYICV